MLPSLTTENSSKCENTNVDLLVAERAAKTKRWEKNTIYEYGAKIVSPLDQLPQSLNQSDNSVFAVVEGRTSLFFKFKDFELPYNG